MQDIYSYIPETNHFLRFRPIIIIILSPVTSRFFLALLLNQQSYPPLTLQVSTCSTFHVMCDVPTTAVFCIESSECFPGMVYKFLIKSFVTIPVAQITIGISIHFMFTFVVSLYVNSYMSYFPASFCVIRPVRWYCHVYYSVYIMFYYYHHHHLLYAGYLYLYS